VTLTAQLFGLTEAGPQPIPLPADLPEPGAVFDRLPHGIYEALRTFDHVRFIGLEEHLDRAERSMELFGLEGPLDRALLRRGLHAIVTEFPARDSKVRFDVLASPASALGVDSRLLVLATELCLPPPSAYRDGVRVRLSELRREHPEVKSAQWILDRRAAPGGTLSNFEPLLVDGEGSLLEGTMSNFFGVLDGVLHTAPTSGVLTGVTRGLVMRAAGELGLEAREVAVRATDLERLEEAFFTTSVRSVVPVVSIADIPLGDGRPGRNTRRLMEAYAGICTAGARPAIQE